MHRTLKACFTTNSVTNAFSVATAIALGYGEFGLWPITNDAPQIDRFVSWLPDNQAAIQY